MILSIKMNDQEIRQILAAHLRLNFGCQNVDPDKIALFIDPQADDKLRLHLSYEERR